MLTLDIFNDDAFSLSSLTATVNNPPEGQITPAPLAEVFDEEGVSTLSVSIERDGDSLALIPASERGSPGDVTLGAKRDLVPFNLLHLSTTAAVYADEVQGVRAFGSETELETVQNIVAKRLTKMRARLDVTLGYHRFGALTGKVFDADGTTVLLDLFARFGITQSTLSFALATATTNVAQKIRDAKRMGEDVISSSGLITGWRGICGRGFYDAFVAHPKVEAAYERWNAGEFLRSDNINGFRFGDVDWTPYYGKVGNVSFIDTDTAYLIPTGIADLFIGRFGPADYMETVNTIGLPYYAKQERIPFDKGVQFELQSNPLHICTKPRAIIRLTK